MDNEYYTYFSNMGKVVISPSSENYLLWDLRVAGKIIGQYTSPEHAISCASKRDFETDYLNREYGRLRVSGEIHLWGRADSRETI